MSIKEIKEGIEKGKVYFGIRQALKNQKKILSVSVAKNARDETIEKLEKAGIKFSVLKSKKDLEQELGLDFKCEVFSLKK